MPEKWTIPIPGNTITRGMGPKASPSQGPSGGQAAAVTALTRAAGRARSLSDWLNTTLAALEQRLGFHHSSLLLVIDTPGVHSPRRAFAGTEHNGQAGTLSDYFAHWADSDPLATEAAHTMFDTQGFACTRDLYPLLDPAGRRFVDEFLASIRTADQMSVRLQGNGTTTAYLTVHEPAVISRAERSVLLELAPALSRQLQRFLPRGLPGPLSPRERQAAELVAFGLTNQEIAVALNIGTDTVKKHLYRATLKLGLERRTQLATSWMTGRLLALPPI
jgi:DNA-binding CsgD family transcriptional regulator